MCPARWTNVNHALVKDGWCWWYRKYAPGDTELERLEKDAREAKKGLWADPQPVPPWEWRKRSNGSGNRKKKNYKKNPIKKRFQGISVKAMLVIRSLPQS